MNLWEILTIFWATVASNRFIKLVLIVVILDTLLGSGRAIKEKQFNSCFGIDGAIRKIAMVISVVILAVIDRLIGFNMLPFVPEEILQYIGITKMGMCEFFCLLYIMYEAVSILKNMCLCGLPIPQKLRTFIEKWLKIMTSELDEKQTDVIIGGGNDEDTTNSRTR
ncbi:phage holin family protein [Lachnospiraceae bacterium MD329]|nr:phage holin family protein [Lachnospiraceae bacterium MD329]